MSLQCNSNPVSPSCEFPQLCGTNQHQSIQNFANNFRKLREFSSSTLFFGASTVTDSRNFVFDAHSRSLFRGLAMSKGKFPPTSLMDYSWQRSPMIIYKLYEPSWWVVIQRDPVLHEFCSYKELISSRKVLIIDSINTQNYLLDFAFIIDQVPGKLRYETKVT